jgi:hypothetical protein
VIAVLNRLNKTSEEVHFLKRAISNIPLFKNNPELLQ